MSTGAKGAVTVEEPTRAQQNVARRVSESKATVPELVLETEVALGAPPSLAVVIRAVALALRAVPRANAAYRDGRFELYGRVNVGFVVDGLVVPTIPDADEKPVEEIAAEVEALAARVRDGSITAAELSGATFTVFTAPVRRITPVILPPQAGILGVGDRGSLTLVCDHRILYGPPAERFLELVARGVA